MRVPAKDRILTWGALVGLFAVLGALAVLQYRWSADVSQAASSRMQRELQTAMIGFRRDFTDELSRISFELQPGFPLGASPDARHYATQLQHWKETATHPSLIKAVYVAQAAGNSKPRLLQFDGGEGRFNLVEWPQEFGDVQRQIGDFASTASKVHGGAPPFAFMDKQPGAMMVPHLYFRSGGAGLPVSAAVEGGLKAPGADDQNGERRLPSQTQHGKAPSLPDDLNLQFFNRKSYLFGNAKGAGQRSAQLFIAWNLDESLPALILPIVTAGGGGTRVEFVIVRLDVSVLEKHIFPELTAQHFGGSVGSDYDVAVRGHAGSSKILYSSSPGFAKGGDQSNDAVMSLIWPPVPPLDGDHRFAGALDPPRDVQVTTQQRGTVAYEARVMSFAAVRPMPVDDGWELVARNRSGSLEAAVAQLRRRNLAISSAVLLVLAGTAVLLVLTTYRARRLADMQMNFVAGVSHELRTPLAVISSAAENIADGVVKDAAQLNRYAHAIRNQAQQLGRLVEQVLLFAATRQRRREHEMTELDVGALVDTALENTADMISAAGVQVERRIAPNLPQVRGTAGAIVQCLQNLITNAVKYGGEARWLGVAAIHQDGEIRVSVSDRGPGITAGELPHLFEPFYRGGAAQASQIHGTGLGLAIAKATAEQMGGRLSVSTEAGMGSSFTLHLLVASVQESKVVGALAQISGSLDEPVR